MCGHGILIFNEKKKYVGEFKDNMLHGDGILIETDDEGNVDQ